MSGTNKGQDSGRGQSWLCKWATVSAAAQMNGARGGETNSVPWPLRHMNPKQGEGKLTQCDAQSAQTY